MSIVAISDTVGSLGTDIGRSVAAALGYELADREIITKAAERFGEAITDLRHAIEEKPRLLERFAESQRRYRAYLEATMLELAARDNVVLVGRASVVILGQAPHTLRVRVDAPEDLRVARVQQREGLTREAALDYVRRLDRERAARVRFLYHAELGDPLRYDVVLNTERLSVERAARIVAELVGDERFRSTAESRRAMRDASLRALADAALVANAITRPHRFTVTCADAVLTVAGTVDAAQVREAAGAVLAGLPGVAEVRNEIAVWPADTESLDALSHGQFRHGEERSWGGYGGGWYDREWQARHPRARRD